MINKEYKFIACNKSYCQRFEKYQLLYRYAEIAGSSHFSPASFLYEKKSSTRKT